MTRENELENNDAFRTYDEFCELYHLLLKTYPALRFPETLQLSKYKDTKDTQRRFNIISSFVVYIIQLSPEISQVETTWIKIL